MNSTKPLALLLLLLVPASVFADDATAQPPSRAGLHFDVEVDPTAYVLGGYSVHVGIPWKRLRLDLGAFAMDVPGFVHGNDGFDASFDGFGAKLHWFLTGEQDGAFVGLATGRMSHRIELEGTGLSTRRERWNAGVELGWRFELYRGLYATPWLGVDYTFGARDVTLAGRTFESSSWSLFPAVHVGYRFL